MSSISGMIQSLTRGVSFEQIYNAIKASKNPQQLVIGTMKKYGAGNPMVDTLVKLASDNDTEGIEQFARNICKENNVDFDAEFSKFKQQLGI